MAIEDHYVGPLCPAKRHRNNEPNTNDLKNNQVRNITQSESLTNGVGMKLMKLMGYKDGTGLGKNEQGIVVLVQAKLRPKNMGMGFGNFKETDSFRVLDEPLIVAKSSTGTSATAVPYQSSDRFWSKQKQGKKKAEGLTRKQEEQGVKMVQEIIDMRAPQVRVLTSFQNLNTQMEIDNNNNNNNCNYSNILMPELQYNIRLIVETTEVEIQRKDRDLRSEREKVAIFLKEKEEIKSIEVKQRKGLQELETIMRIVDQVKEENLLGLTTIDSIVNTFSDLKLRFKEEYEIYNLPTILRAFTHPLLLKIFRKWDPLHDPLHGLQQIRSLKNLLQADHEPNFDSSDSLYTQLISEFILPAIHIHSTNSWHAKNPDSMLTLLYTWGSLLPPVILDSILDNIIMPKLTEAVYTWDPSVDQTVPIHVWIHPWLPLLGIKLEILYCSIRYKLGCVLQTWQANDPSVFTILSPWKDVFAPESWDKLLLTHVIPKLRLALQKLEIQSGNQNQNVDQFGWVMWWTGSMADRQLADLLETEFFSKWHEVLYSWLCSSPDFADVASWFVGWKSFFPEELVANERIRVSFKTGLDMMNQAVEGKQVQKWRGTGEIKQERIQQNWTGDLQFMLSFKESIEKYALAHGVLFGPRVGKFYEGREVYGFGSVSVHVDSVKRLIYARGENGEWSAVSLGQLMEMNGNNDGNEKK